MPIYKITAPDGRKIKLTGDTPPTEQELEQIFANLPSKIETKQPQELSTIQKVSNLANVLNPVKKLPDIAQQPGKEALAYGKALGETGLELAQIAGGVMAPQYATAKLGTQGIAKLAPYLASGLSTAGTQAGIEAIEGKNPSEIAKQSGVAGASDILFSALTKGVSSMAKKALPSVTEFASGVPKESTKKALKSLEEGKSIFSPDFKPVEEFSKAGNKAQNAVNNIVKQAGEAVGKEKEALKNFRWRKLSPLETNKIINQIDNLKAEKQFGRINTLNNRDLAKIDGIQNKLKDFNDVYGEKYLKEGRGIATDELYGLKKNIDDLVTYDPNSVKKISEEGAGVLKKIRSILDDKIKEVSPEYAKVANKYSGIKTLHDNIINTLKGESDITENELGSLLKNESGVAGTQIKKILEKAAKNPDEIPKYLPTLKAIDNLAPKQDKFMDKFSDIIARNEAKKQFENLMPQTPIRKRISDTLIHSSVLSPIIGAASGNMGYGAAGMGGAIATATAMSPKSYKNLIKLVSKPSTELGKVAKTAAYGAGKQAATRTATKLKIADLLGINKGEE